MKLLSKAAKTVKKYNMFSKGDSVAVGVSGGADSVTLLYLLKSMSKEYDLHIKVVHINHNLRGEAALSDENFVRELCKKLDVECHIFSIDIKNFAKEKGLTLEEAGRIKRYEAFKSMACSKTAVAHNLDDSCETMLLNLFRGTGTKGLSGILPIRDNIIRPLIETSRREIEDFCRENNIQYCTDSTNYETVYTRNKIRLELLPWIRENINSSVTAALSRTSAAVMMDENYIEEQAHIKYKQALIKKGCLDAEMLKNTPDALVYRIIRLCIKDTVNTLKDISYEHINSVCELIYKESGKRLSLPYGLAAVKEGSTIKIYKDDNISFDYVLNMNDTIFIEEKGLYVTLSDNNIKNIFSYVYKFDKSRIKGNIHIRTRRKGDIFALKNRDKKLKKVMIDMKIPVSQRNSIPILCDEEKVFAIVGYNIDNSRKGNLYIYVKEKKV